MTQQKFASGKHALGICDRCGLEYKLQTLRNITLNDNLTNLLVCQSCYEPDHPQNKVGKYIVVDPQALQNPRPDASELVDSRNIQWGWRPVGFNNPLDLTGLNNNLEASGSVGAVTITTD